MVSRSVIVCVGWLCEPSPALMMGVRDTSVAARGAPSTLCRMAIMSAKQLMTLTVSCTVSPFDTDELLASAKPITLPPSSIIADVKLRRVRVLGS